jgi:hypothetical protein
MSCLVCSFVPRGSDMISAVIVFVVLFVASERDFE